LNSSKTDSLVLKLLDLLETGSYLARSVSKEDVLYTSFFAIKDQSMALIYRLLYHTGALSYYFIPYVERCSECKKKADALHNADSSRSWEYHLNLLPLCPKDREVSERSMVSMTVRYPDRKFNLHVPMKEVLKWNLDVDQLDKRVWVPDKDFVSHPVYSSMSIKEIIDSIKIVLAELEDINLSIGHTSCDVFLSAVSKDYPLAMKVRDFLLSKEKRVFLAPVSLQNQGDTDYRKVIDKALESADHLVLVVSDGKNAESRWVEYEWGVFLNEKLSGRKSGNLLTVAAGSCKFEDLPIALRSREILPLDENGLQRLLAYLKQQ
jgi:hypothetical protein